MLDLRDLSLEGVERFCQAEMTWKLVPLYYCPGKEREACIVFVCSQLAVLVFSSSSTSFQIGLFINGNKVMSYLKEHGESGSKKISNDQELIQSDPTSCPQNQKGK